MRALKMPKSLRRGIFEARYFQSCRLAETTCDTRTAGSETMMSASDLSFPSLRSHQPPDNLVRHAAAACRPRRYAALRAVAHAPFASCTIQQKAAACRLVLCIIHVVVQPPQLRSGLQCIPCKGSGTCTCDVNDIEGDASELDLSLIHI